MTNVKQALRHHRIGLIGAGTMGSALLHGWLAAGIPRPRLRVAEARAHQRRQIARTWRVRVTADVQHVARASTIVVLAVKPQELPSVLCALRDVDTAPLTLSIAAGVTTKRLERALGRVAVIRAMPNTAARVGASIVALSRGRFAARRHVAAAQAVFAAVGETVMVPERLLDAVTAVSGSGPAYYFWLTEQLARAGRAVGLPRITAERLARQTAIGSGILLAHSTESPEQLRAQVTSTGGTTAAALRMMAREQLGRRFARAVRAAQQRARELSS